MRRPGRASREARRTPGGGHQVKSLLRKRAEPSPNPQSQKTSPNFSGSCKRENLKTEECRQKPSLVGDAVTSGGGSEDPWAGSLPWVTASLRLASRSFPSACPGNGQAWGRAGPCLPLQWSSPPFHPGKEQGDTNAPLAAASAPEGLKA